MDAWDLIILLGVTAIWLGFASAIVWLVAVSPTRR